MTPDQFRAALVTLRWSGRNVAMLAGYSPSLAAQWANGRSSVPPRVAKWLAALVAAHEKVGPLPDERQEEPATRP